ncbi:MAG: hypothetical protein LBJ39_01380 [Tannerellaceae bacterium]|jgi:hypothetical protein|nr:hypothetical protein [Tannerellaceae bacterium]
MNDLSEHGPTLLPADGQRMISVNPVYPKYYNICSKGNTFEVKTLHTFYVYIRKQFYLCKEQTGSIMGNLGYGFCPTHPGELLIVRQDKSLARCINEIRKMASTL